jgi:KTSC domain
MNMKPVESTTLVAIGYDEAREILQLEFRSHAVYGYFGVPGSVYEELVAAPSKGRYFNGAIRGHFPYSLISRTSSGQGGET